MQKKKMERNLSLTYLRILSYYIYLCHLHLKHTKEIIYIKATFYA